MRFGQTLSPHGNSFGEDVAIKEGILKRAAIMPSPTVGMDRGDGFSVGALGIA